MVTNLITICFCNDVKWYGMEQRQTNVYGQTVYVYVYILMNSLLLLFYFRVKPTVVLDCKWQKNPWKILRKRFCFVNYFNFCDQIAGQGIGFYLKVVFKTNLKNCYKSNEMVHNPFLLKYLRCILIINQSFIIMELKW